LIQEKRAHFEKRGEKKAEVKRGVHESSEGKREESGIIWILRRGGTYAVPALKPWEERRNHTVKCTIHHGRRRELLTLQP